jgi:DNA repair protein RadA/Sms
MKKTTSFVCQECGYDTTSWLGKCPECGSWNSLKELKIPTLSTRKSAGSGLVASSSKPQILKEIAYSEKLRIRSGFAEMDTVLGGGLVLGSVTLLAGDPGVGKSTVLLQLCLHLAAAGKKVLYISGEESVEQIKLRATRIAPDADQQTSLFLLAESDPDNALVHIENSKPDLVIVDSVQTMQSENLTGLSGSVGQVRYAAMSFIKAAKALGIPHILVGHVTKEGMVAGPMVLSHMVDTVLFLEGEKSAAIRILRSLKNRFGPVDEVGVFQMEESGMIEVTNPEQIFLQGFSGEDVPGSVMVVTMEGTRAFLVELQALAVYSRLPMPRRVVSGMDQKRVELLLAVLQKHIRLPVDTMDIFVNVAGGMKLSDPGIDLGICLALYSSVKNIPLRKTVGIAEVGLLGELRSVRHLEKRIREAEKLGFSNIITFEKARTLHAALHSFETGSKTAKNIV